MSEPDPAQTRPASSSRFAMLVAAGIFLSHSFRRLPVVQNGAVVGAITRYDILRAIQANFR